MAEFFQGVLTVLAVEFVALVLIAFARGKR